MAVNDKPKNKPAAQDMRSSRTKAGINVIISIVAATALLVVANVVANMAIPSQRMRWNIETLGRYGLSESAKRILDQVSQPAKISVAYRSTDPDKKPDDHLPALRDLLGEMHQYKPNLVFTVVGSDRGLAEMMARVRDNINESAKDHRKAVLEFQGLWERQLPLYEEVLKQWKAYPAKGWLCQFSIPKGVEQAMEDSREDLRKLSMQIRSDLGGSSLPDYPAMTGQISQTLKRIKDERLELIRTSLRELGTLPEKAQKTSPALLAALDKFTESVKKAGALMTSEADPADALAKFAAATREIAESAETAVKILSELESVSSFLRYTGCWQIEVGTAEGSQAAYLPEVYQQLGRLAMNWGAQAEGVRTNANKEAQKKFVGSVANAMPALTLQARKARTAVEDMLAQVSKLDDATKQCLEDVQKEDYLTELIKPVAQLQEQVAKLPQLEDQSELVERIKQDNFILIEMDNKLAVVSFDDAWPMGSRREMMEPEEQQSARVFYGDMAISSKLLSMASRPFAEVVLTYYEMVPPQQYWSQAPPVVGPIYSQQLATLRERLTRANLKVVDWNLAKEEAPPKPAEGAKQVLLVLPTPDSTPPNPMMDPAKANQFTPEHAAKVTAIIDAGAPAIFLAGYVRPRQSFGPPMPASYGWDNYLSKNWGVEVREETRVLEAVRDPLEPDKFQLPVLRWDFMPLSSFTDHPIGKPLRARRFYWLSTCPVARTASPAPGVTVRDILVAPKGMEGIWATAEPEKMWRDIVMGKGSGIVPDKQADIMPPFSLVVEATRKTDSATNSVVVLGVGLSYIDNFLTARIPQLKGGDTLTTEPPPSGDVDLLINSVYYLVGKTEYIGAGPAIVQPIGLIEAGRMSLIKYVFGLGWPALVLVVGLAVTWARRR